MDFFQYIRDYFPNSELVALYLITLRLPNRIAGVRRT